MANPEHTDDEDDGAGEDAREPPSLPSGAPPATSSTVQTMADVRALLKRGDSDGALAGLYKLRRGQPTPPRAADIAVAIGHIYFERRWWTDALREFRFACHVDARHRSDATLISDTVRALGDKKTAARARCLLVDVVGRSALPALRTASRSGPVEARKRAQATLEQIQSQSKQAKRK